MNADHAEKIAALEAAIRNAQATLDRIAAEEPTEPAEPAGPRLATAEDGRREARRRHPSRSAASTDGTAEGSTTADPQESGGAATGTAGPRALTAADGRREAQRRAARRTSGSAA
jgi:hypothetical protein